MDGMQGPVAAKLRQAALVALPRLPVRPLLILLTLSCLIPGLIGAALLVYHDYRAGRALFEKNSFQTTRALVQAVDSHLFKAQAVAQSLSTSDALRRQDFAALYRHARALLALNPLGSSIALSDTTGQQLFNTSREFGEPLPKHGSAEQIRRVVETGQPSISRVFKGAVSQQLLVTVDVPVILDGKVAYVVTAVLRPDIFNAILKGQSLPPDWIAGILDSDGTFVTRSHSPEVFIGRKPSAEFSQRIREDVEGAFESLTPDGIPVLTIYSRSPVTGWTVGLGIPRYVLEAEYWRPLTILALGMVVLFTLGLGLAWFVAERIARSIRALTVPAQALGMGRPVRLPEVHIKEAADVAEALADASDLLQRRTTALDEERKGRQRELEQLVAERTEALQSAVQELENLARRDALTGLQNRLSANERLREEFLRIRRTSRPHAVLLMDIDHFKRINDTYGHEAGDHVLQQVGNVLKASIRATDFVARFGGEEFLVLLPETGADGALTIAEKIRLAVAAATLPGIAGVTISIGVSTALPEDSSEDQAVRRADKALYQAKAEGRNRVQLLPA